MKTIVPAMFLCVFLVLSSGCRVIGDKSVSLLSPEEKELIETHRELKRRPARKKRSVVKYPNPKTKEEAMENLSVALQDLKADAKELRKENEARRLEEGRWGFKWSWDRGVATPGKPSADHPEYDNDGNLIVSPEVVRSYRIPDIHVGAFWDVTEDKLRSVLEVEVFELKVPRFNHFPVGIVAAEQYLGIHISKRWTSVFEIETGIAVGRDFDSDKNTVGLGALIIKF